MANQNHAVDAGIGLPEWPSGTQPTMTVARCSLIVLMIAAVSTRAFGHDALSALATWGNFGDAAPCQRVVSSAALDCGAAAAAARRVCYAAALDGGACDETARAAELDAARTRALDAIASGCSEQQAARLKASGVADLLADAIRACRAIERGIVEPVYAPLRARDSADAAASTRACVAATAAAATQLGWRAAATWKWTFEMIAGRSLTVAQKGGLAGRAAIRVNRGRVAVGRMLATRCTGAEFTAIYAQPADNLLAGVAQAGSCFAEAAFQQ